jgi:UTP-glucose-1-phosphate uridylyltransferase
MSFEKSIREDHSNIPAIIFLGGKGKRMEIAYKEILPSKEWLPIGFDEKGEPIPLFWRNFEILLGLGFKEFYFVVTGEGGKIKRYFEKKFEGREVNIQLLNKESLSKISKSNVVNIYIFENNEREIGDQFLVLKSVINHRTFLRVYGDEYFGGEKEKIKNEIRLFIEYALEKIEIEKAINVFAFVDRKITIGSVWEGFGIEGNKQSGKLVKINELNFIPSSLCVTSPEFFDILQSEKKNSVPLDISSPEIVKRIIESQRAYGKVIDLEAFSNVNTRNDYYRLVSKIENFKKIKVKTMSNHSN